MSWEACQIYWSHQHATLALDNLRYNPLTRCRQVHTPPAPPAGLDDNYDGVVFAEKTSIGHLLLQARADQHRPLQQHQGRRRVPLHLRYSRDTDADAAAAAPDLVVQAGLPGNG